MIVHLRASSCIAPLVHRVYAPFWSCTRACQQDGWVVRVSLGKRAQANCEFVKKPQKTRENDFRNPRIVVSPFAQIRRNARKRTYENPRAAQKFFLRFSGVLERFPKMSCALKRLTAHNSPLSMACVLPPFELDSPDLTRGAPHGAARRRNIFSPARWPTRNMRRQHTIWLGLGDASATLRRDRGTTDGNFHRS